MELTQSSSELSTASKDATHGNSNLEPCFHFSSGFFETVSSTAPYIVNPSLNAPLALVTTVANTLVLLAMRKNTSLHLPSKLLLGSLVLSDLGVGIAAQPMFVVFLVAKVKGSSGILCPVYALLSSVGSMLNCLSLLTMTAISLDGYITLYFHLRYRDIVTTKRVFSVLVVIWPFAGFYGFLLLQNLMIQTYLVIVINSMCFIVCTLSYRMIYRRLRHQNVNQVTAQAQLQIQQHAANPLNVARYRRSASNMLWIYGLFLLCYLPHALTRVAITLMGQSLLIHCIREFAITVLCFNSCLNPFVYCYRLPGIRASVLETLHTICGRRPQQ